MVNRCVNPACATEFRLLNSGDLYAIERPCSETEFFWICANCASKFELFLDASDCIALRPRGQGETIHPPQLHASLRLVARARRHMPWRHGVPAGSSSHFVNHGGWGASTNGAHL